MVHLQRSSHQVGYLATSGNLASKTVPDTVVSLWYVHYISSELRLYPWEFGIWITSMKWTPTWAVGVNKSLHYNILKFLDIGMLLINHFEINIFITDNKDMPIELMHSPWSVWFLDFLALKFIITKLQIHNDDSQCPKQYFRHCLYRWKIYMPSESLFSNG